MLTLQEFGVEVAKIREAINEITTKGSENASLIVYATKKCNDVIQAINDAVQELRNPPASQNGEDFVETGEEIEEEEGEVNGEPDSGTITGD